jgi:predicted deacylase
MSSKNIIISSGQHGNEPFAITTLLKWIRQPIMFGDLNYFVFPVVNMFGYATNSRDNGNRQDTNNDANFVKNSKVPELAILFEQFPQTADLLLDIHGDTGKSNVYIYEHKVDSLPSIAEKALMENDTLLSFSRAKTIYKMKVINGVVTPPLSDIGIEGFMEKLGVRYTITLELPGKFDGQKRAEGGVAIINSILRHFVEN